MQTSFQKHANENYSQDKPKHDKLEVQLSILPGSNHHDITPDRNKTANKEKKPRFS